MIFALRTFGFLSVAFVSGLAFAAESPRSVSVSGSCLRRVIPDRGAVTVTIDAKDPDAKRAQTAATRQYEAVRTKLLGLRLADGEISTAEYQSEEIREWEKNKMVSRGFRTRIALRTETSDHSRLGDVIDVASREGVKEIGGLQLFVSSKKSMEERMACLKDASDQARAKAETLAKALGAKIGEVLTIQENSSPEMPTPGPMYKTMMAADSTEMSARPTIEPGKTEISTNVLVTFGLK